MIVVNVRLLSAMRRSLQMCGFAVWFFNWMLYYIAAGPLLDSESVEPAVALIIHCFITFDCTSN